MTEPIIAYRTWNLIDGQLRAVGMTSAPPWPVRQRLDAKCEYSDPLGLTTLGEASSNAKLTVALVEEIIRTDFSASGSVGTLAERLGVTTGAIMAVLTRRTWRSVTDGRIILSEGNVGKIHTELSAERRSRATKAQFLAGRTMTGERNPRAKTTWDDVREIRRIGVGPRGSNQRLAERFGITKGQIGRILNGSSWIE